MYNDYEKICQEYIKKLGTMEKGTKEYLETNIEYVEKQIEYKESHLNGNSTLMTNIIKEDLDILYNKLLTLRDKYLDIVEAELDC